MCRKLDRFYSRYVALFVVLLYFQVKPLLEVTKQEEKLSKKEEELKTIRDKLDSQLREVEELDRQLRQAQEDKNFLADRLQAETELCAEAEEMRLR